MNGNYYAIDIWGLIAALVMVAIAAGISETMRMGVGRTLLWSACRALLQLCAMGFIMEYVIRSNNPWLVLLLGLGLVVSSVVGMFAPSQTQMQPLATSALASSRFSSFCVAHGMAMSHFASVHGRLPS